MTGPGFLEFAAFLRAWARIPSTTQIMPGTLFEDDLGITGDDGGDLLEATAIQYGIHLTSDLFDLAPNEFLFHPEGFGPNWSELLGRPSITVREFSVGELYDAILKSAGKF